MNEQSIFAAALAKTSDSERSAFLDEACGQNACLRAQVEELLASDAGAGSFLEHPPAGLDLPLNATLIGTNSNIGLPKGSLPFLQPCDTPGRIGKLGVYEVIEVVGQGGMGSVLRAMDTKLSRVVAVKVMAQELAANPMAVKRFLREAQSAAAVVHDHVVTIHAVDDQSQPPYLVMEFVQGQTLQQKIDREGALQLRHILRIGSQTAAGLAAAHRTGLIHRDVKPANILLENGVERVKITDFGLARAADDVEMTKTGMIAGTPQYMSPEQANGGQIDFRSDLFSLGSVLYTMCTGRPAFRAETMMGTLRRVTDDLPRPIRELNSEIPDWLDAIIRNLMAKKADDRIQSAAEVAELLNQHLAHMQNPSEVSRPAGVELPGAQPQFGRELKSGQSDSILAPQRKSALTRTGLAWGLIGLAFAGAIATFGTVGKRIVFNQGTVQFAGAQGVSQARIEIDRNGELVNVLTFPTVRQIDLQSGEYQLDVTQVPPPSGALAATLLFPKTISVRRGRTQKVEISWMRAAPANVPVRAVDSGKIEIKELSTFAPQQNGTPPAKPAFAKEALAQGEVRRISRRTSSYVKQLRVSVDGESLFTASADGFAQQLPLKAGGASQTLHSHSSSMDALAVSADGMRLLAGYQDGKIVLWEGSPFVRKRELVGHTGPLTGLAFTRDGRRAVSCSADWHNHQDVTVRLWDVDTGEMVRRFNGGYFANLSVAISPDDRQLLVGAQMVNSRGLVGLFDLETGQLVREFPGHYSDVWHVQFSPDGSQALTTHMAVAEQNGLWDDPEHCVVRLWDVASATETRQLRGHRSGVLSAAFSRDGKYVVSGSGPQHDTSGRFKEASDYSVRIWDVESGAELQTAKCDKPPIAVGFSRDGESVFSAGGEPYIREWRFAALRSP